MRTICTLCIGLLFAAPAIAQKKIPEFGQFVTAERQITSCEFDPEAEAVVIFDKAEADHNDENNLITHRRKRIKILKPNGIDEGNVEIVYYSKDDFEVIRDLQAIVCNFEPDGSVRTKTVPQSAFFKTKIDERLSKIRFAAPDVQVGSIIEYEYTIVAKNYNGLDDWLFQSHLPTMLSSFHLVILPNAEFAYSVSKSPSLPIIVTPHKNEGAIYFEMSNIAALRGEPFMDAPRDYIQKVEFQLSGYTSRFGGKSKYMTTWDELSKEFLNHPYMGGQLNKSMSGTDELLNAAKALPTDYERMVHVYNEVQKTIFAQLPKTYYAPDGVRNAWKTKTGTSAEVNLVLINLLRSLHLEAYPLLVSERDHGKVMEDYPFIEQFNNLLAYVIIGDQKYVLDAANSYIPPHLIPPSVVNTKGFLVDRKKKGMIDLTDVKRREKDRIVVVSAIDEEGKIRGTVNIKSYDYSRLQRSDLLNRGKEKELEKYYTAAFPTMEADSFTVKQTAVDSVPLEQKFVYTTRIGSSGEYKLLNLNMFTGYYHNPFISDIRFTDVNFGYPKSLEVLQMITLPTGWKPESIPKDSKLITPDNGITSARFITFTNNTLNVLFRIDFNRTVFDSGEYPILKEFYKKMINQLNEQIVLVH